MRALPIVILLLALPLEVRAQSSTGASDEATARAAFVRGVELANSQPHRCVEAIEQFWIAHRLFPERPSPLYAIGSCQMRLGGAENDRTALETFEQYLDRNDDDQDRRRDVRANVTTLLRRLNLGTLRLDVTPPSATVTVDGGEVLPGRLDRVRLAPGEHRVTVSAPGFEEETRTVTVTRASGDGEPEPEVIALVEAGAVPDDGDPDSDQPRSGVHRQWWFWTIIGAVVVGGAVGLGLGLRDDGVPQGDWRLDLP